MRARQWIMLALLAAAVLSGGAVPRAVALALLVALTADLVLAGRRTQELLAALHRRGERLDQLLHESRDVIVHVDQHGVIRFANEALREVLGLVPATVLGRPGRELLHPDDRDHFVQELARLGDDPPVGRRIVARFRHADGSSRSVEVTVAHRASGDPGYTLSARDVSDRVTLEADLRHRARTDPLTGLVNRADFLARVTHRLRPGPATVLFLDLDGFKGVNDLDGHAAGDNLLREVAEVLRRQLLPSDVVARIGGDEFAVLLTDPDPARAGRTADQLAARLRRLPSDPAGRTAASLGLATGVGVSAEELLADADLAMYEAKARGGRVHVVFEPGLRARAAERIRITEAITRAGTGAGLLLEVQPIVLLADGRRTGFEALVRWRDGARRRLPHEFLPIAEEVGVIEPIGRWVLHRSLAWLAACADPSLGVSVNVAPAQLAAPGFASWLTRELADTGVEPARLTLEFGPRIAPDRQDRIRGLLTDLRTHGIRLCLDDVGAGATPLEYLGTLPLDELKIDRRLVAGLGRRPREESLVRVICRTAADLGLRAVAEGVETSAQKRALLDRGCRLGQGYLFGRPEPAAGCPRDATAPVC